MPDIALSPSQQAQVDDYTKKHTALLEQRAKLDAERLNILSQPVQSIEQQARVSAINIALEQISANIADLTRTATDNLPADAIVKTTIQQDIVKEMIVKLAPPPPGAFNIIHGNVQQGDIISYMKFTQYLNPYGRKRQCDTDLENLMSVINKDCNNQIAEYNKLVKEISSVAQS